ncbi:uncharacterized protein LOC106092223 [Stomoxys calcitrans]|uniref:MARVEL domain-containing protein n=1 Tax=Stomoxys calcitrans TaxID=35570 RepID=A0A1I8PEZ3_STOCA|nr:uncharacterized protein LOC106092223 [Stomoxys calcitrans]
MTEEKLRCTISSYISLFVGWFHLIFSTILFFGLFYYLCVRFERPNDNPQIAALGLPVLLILFTFSFASFVFDILLITGILVRQVKLVSAFVFGNYMILGFVASSAVFYFAEDYVHDVTTIGSVVNPLLHGLTLGTAIYLFYPVYLLVQQTREPPSNEHSQLDDSEILKDNKSNKSNSDGSQAKIV